MSAETENKGQQPAASGQQPAANSQRPLPEMFSLAGKAALVTGGTKGIGQAIAVGLAEAGADVVVLGRSAADETVAQIEAMGQKAYSLQQNLIGLEPAAATEIVNQAVQLAGRLDILVNNAGIQRRSPALHFSYEDWQLVLDVNLNSYFLLSQAAARHFITQAQTGKIINVASVISYQGGLYIPAYSAAKSAVAGLTQSFSNEWAKLGINVNAIAPGYIASNMTEALIADETRSVSILERIPAARWGQPEDMKGIAVYLASAASDYAHGATFVVDGGWLGR